jgi:hypothetical protein
MRHASALAASPHLVELPLPRTAATQLRLALDLLSGAPDDGPAPIPLRAHADRVRVVLHPRLAWPDRPERARTPDGSAAPRRADFYDWILARRRHAQMAARRAVEDGE